MKPGIEKIRRDNDGTLFRPRAYKELVIGAGLKTREILGPPSE
jgi:hypothetical protein